MVFYILCLLLHCCSIVLCQDNPPVNMNPVAAGGTPDDVWDGIKTSLDGILKLTKPYLDNEIVKESEKTINLTILEPMNRTVQGNRKDIKYDRSSILRIASDVTILNDGVMKLREDMNRTEQKLVVLQMGVDRNGLLLNNTYDDVQGLKKNVRDLKVGAQDAAKLISETNEEVRTLTHDMEVMRDEMASKAQLQTVQADMATKEDLADMVRKEDLADMVRKEDLAPMNENIQQILDIMKRHNWTNTDNY